ncbi:uncharacterized protein LOC106169210 [Lingula anatina]|uniref:Uncharacterized protein LOC106169210 n=1 Tax=Lingula anatina TaxID=7574 RepID=A0A1S3J1C4_LINAN|nr:uncharacterized protein LOC106169210 [Lingula anatina]|eukprot:XP_013404058.1 uncharacterized protein LOC106169210 [Lingula anatina]
MKAFFDIVDMDGDGVVTKEEFIDLRAQRAQNVLGSWRAKAVYGIISHSYRTWWSNENTNYKTSITFEEWFTALEKKIYNTNEAFNQSSWDWFHTFDLDCNDKLTVDEYSKFLTMFRNTAPVENVFNAIDLDGNGSIDGEEFLNGNHHKWKPYTITVDFPIMETRRVLLLVVLWGGIVSSNAVKESNIKFTEHWVSKMKALFDLVDMDGDGVVTKEEFIDLRAQRAQNVLESWRAKAVYGIISHSYRTWWSNENTNFATSITFGEVLPALEKEVDDSSEAVDINAWDWFHTFDLDCNDKLTEDEYSKFIAVFRNTAPVELVFKATDLDGNGSIDGEEFLNGMHHTWYDEAPNPGEFLIASRN